MGTPLTWTGYQSQLKHLAELDYNYDEKLYHGTIDKSGWFIDRYQSVLAIEPPGPPLEHGAFEAARRAIHLYKFPDPRLIEAVFDPHAELRGRNMLMIAKFAGFRFRFGVRVTDVIDSTKTNPDGTAVKSWGYAYRTLKGHFEVGEIRFEVRKNLTTGSVDFEIDAYSKPERIPNLLYRSGFRLFGRHLQKYFAFSSIERLKRISNRALAERGSTVPDGGGLRFGPSGAQS